MRIGRAFDTDALRAAEGLVAGAIFLGLAGRLAACVEAEAAARAVVAGSAFHALSALDIANAVSAVGIHGAS